PHLRQLFKRFATYNGSDPYQAPATLNVIAHVELSLGGYYVKGGLYQIARALEQLARELGVNLHTQACVEGFCTKANSQQLTGFIVNGQEQRFDLVFSNCDATLTHTELA
ncbi:hypothetical protein RZS08_35880, partial [Arthrospira platensis SPKY1]|nr:hypothetical protein [Arthrospira platensis SPKY1]